MLLEHIRFKQRQALKIEIKSKNYIATHPLNTDLLHIIPKNDLGHLPDKPTTHLQSEA